MRTTPVPETVDVTADAVMTVATSVSASTPLARVWEVMQHHHLDHVVVTDAAVPLGVVDRQDIWTVWAHGLAHSAAPTRWAVTATPCVGPDTPLNELRSALMQAHHETVLVLDDEGCLCGVVTAENLLAHLCDKDVP